MNADTRTAIRAFAIAPLLVPVLWWIRMLVSGHSGAKGPIDAFGGLVFIVIAAAPWIYGSAVVVCVPSLWAIRRWSQLRPWHPILIGGCLGLIVYPMTYAIPTTVDMLLSGAVMGASAGGLFWLLYRRAA